jgi:4-hydroxymandelate oxidase
MTYNSAVSSPELDLPALDLSRLINLHDFEREGQARLTQNALEYYRSGANDGHTLRGNQGAFTRLLLRPRMLNDVSHVKLETTVLGLPISSPIAVAPSAFHGLAHRQAELGTAQAVQEAGTVMTLSTLSNTSIERVATQTDGRLWFQLYLYRDRELARALIQRAEAAGARAIVLTVDAPELGRRESNERLGFSLPPHLEAPNVGTREQLAQLEGSGSHLTRYFAGLMDASLNWKDLEWLRGVTGLPIVLKGILTAEDAALGVQHGAAGIWVSNHGGRQLDTAVPGIEALEEVVQAVSGRAEVYLDGGVRRGTDVLKALALGARAVFLGRPVLYGLACGGSAGVARVLALLHEELRLAMVLSGQTDVHALTPDLVRWGHAYQ